MNLRDLRHEREVRALSLRQVSEATGIPMDILASLEAEPDAMLRPGSTIARWREEYERYLARQPQVAPPAPVEPAGEAREPTETTALLSGAAFRGPRGVGRAVALGVAVAVVVALVFQITSLLMDPGQASSERGAAAEVAAAGPMAHRLSIRAVEPTRLRVEADGAVVQDGVLPARTSLEFEARERLVVDLPDLTGVRMRYNDRALTPLGNLSTGRRLVFIDDEGR